MQTDTEDTHRQSQTEKCRQTGTDTERTDTGIDRQTQTDTHRRWTQTLTD
jgi:hypothetical protein